jgi:anthranilate phosphoribosyltransferase
MWSRTSAALYLAPALARLGTTRAWVVRGEDGLDEMSPSGPTRVTELAFGSLVERIVTPEDFGLSRTPSGALDGGDAAHNAARIRAILGGSDDAASDAVALNAAAAIAIGRDRTDLPGLRTAAEDALTALRSGAALRTPDAWVGAARATRVARNVTPSPGRST